MPTDWIEESLAVQVDSVAQYALALGFNVKPRTILVEGTTDVKLFELAVSLEREKTGIDLLGNDLAIIAAGERDRGGTRGVVRELISFRGMARACLLPNGRPRYRFIGLFDNDRAGKDAVKLARTIDNSILEYKDVYRLWPVMPRPGNLDPGTVQRSFERENAGYKGLDWELEDLLTQEFVDSFLKVHSGAVKKTVSSGDKVHREFSTDGKANFHRFINARARYEDVYPVILVLKAIRFYLMLPCN